MLACPHCFSTEPCRCCHLDPDDRPTWDETWLGLLPGIARRATCNRGRSGCVIVKDNSLLVTGYVGSLPKQPHCDEVGHLMKTVVHADGTRTAHCVRTVHAEANAITIAARRGVALEGGTLYCTMFPCRSCTMLLIGARLLRVVAMMDYQDSRESKEMLNATGVKWELKSTIVKPYFDDRTLLVAAEPTGSEPDAGDEDPNQNG